MTTVDVWELDRAALPALLGSYAGASDVTIEVGERGKPYVPGLPFNVTHSAGRTLVAVAPVEVGIDLERIRPRGGIDGVIRRAFSAAERAFVDAAVDRLAAFYDVWTAKEACAKAAGTGLAGLRAFDVVADDAVAGTGHWHVAPLPLGAGWAAAVAIETAAAPPAVVLRGHWGKDQPRRQVTGVGVDALAES